MTMFTTTFTTDHSIDRWIITVEGKRYEIAYAQDIDADSPFDWGWEGLYILSHDYRRIDAGDESIKTRMDDWLGEKDLLEDMIINPHHYAEGVDLEDAVAAHEQHDEDRPNVLVFDHLDYTVFVDRAYFSDYYADGTDEGIEVAARDMVETYHAWAEGNVYVGAIAPLDDPGNTHYVGGIYLGDDCSAREQIEDIMGINLI